jgi:pimeloyl-ACP methyl ester carboxylesterase
MPYFGATDGVSLFYEGVGTGPPLVLQTGGAGDGSMWRDAGYVDFLGLTRTCLLFDHRGHGRSDQPRLAEAHTVQRYAADVIALLDHAGIDRAAFWGYSQGADVGLMVAALRPERLTCLITTGVMSNPDREAVAAEDAASASVIRQRGWDGILDPAELASVPEWFERQVQSTNPEMLALWWEANAGWDPWVHLPQIKVPTLMFVGELEDPEHWNSRAAHLAPDATVIRLPGLDHLEAYVRSDLVVPAAMEFLSARQPAAR